MDFGLGGLVVVGLIWVWVGGMVFGVWRLLIVFWLYLFCGEICFIGFFCFYLVGVLFLLCFCLRCLGVIFVCKWVVFWVCIWIVVFVCFLIDSV